MRLAPANSLGSRCAVRVLSLVVALVMAVLLARTPLDRHVGRRLFVSVAIYGLAIVVFALSTHFIVAMAALAVSGAADMVSIVVRQTLVQLETPDEMRGRVSAVNGTFIQASNQLGEFRAGALAAIATSNASNRTLGPPVGDCNVSSGANSRMSDAFSLASIKSHDIITRLKETVLRKRHI